MRYGAIYSAGLHIVIILFAIMGLPNLLKSERPEIVPISVEIVRLEEKAADREPPKPQPRPEAKKAAPKPPPPKVAARTPPPAPAPPPPETVKIPEPEPMPKPVAKPPPPKPEPPKPEIPAPKPAAKPEPPKPEPPEPEVAKSPPPTPAPRPKRKPKAPAPQPDAFQALLKNLEKEKKAQEKAPKPEKPVARAAERPTPETRRRSALEEQRIAASLAQAIMRQVTPCWSIPAGAKDAAGMSVAIRMRFNPDGSLASLPRVEDETRLRHDPFFRALAESALRALRNHQCMPLRLPYEQYDLWKDVTFVFDPREALGQ